MLKTLPKIYFRGLVVFGSLVVLVVVVFVFHKIDQAKADSFLPSDFNQDGIVDPKDIDLIKQNYANTAGGILNPSPYDLNNDHKINSLDLAIVEDNQGNGTNPDRDWDKDGYTVAENDCDDRNTDVNPIAKEKADQIDNNCNGSVDELVGYVPTSAPAYYLINLHYEKQQSGYSLRVDGVTVGNYDSSTVGARTLGTYAVNLFDSNGNLVDFVYFEPPSRKLVEYSNRSDEVLLTSGNFIVKVPKSSNIQTAKIIARDDVRFSIPVDLSQAHASITNVAQAQYDNIPTTPCPESLKPQSSGHYGILFCGGFNEFPHAAGIVKSTFSDLMKYMKQLVYVPLNSFSLFSPQNINAACGIAEGELILGCMDNGNIFMVATESDQNTGAIMTHEFAHFLQDEVTILGHYDANPESPNNDFMRFIQSIGCKQGDTDCKLDGYKLQNAWENRLLQVKVCDYIFCSGDNHGEWKDPVDPVTHELDPRGPRTEYPGVNRPYGLQNNRERWATVYESLYLDIKGIHNLVASTGSHMVSTKDLINGKSKYIPQTTGLTQDLALLGKNGLLPDFDADHDGVPDEYDNCSPRTYAGICKPGEMDACYNPGQEDFVNRSGNAAPDGIGDKCEFQGQLLWFATCYKGMVPPISWQNPTVPNCPAPDYTNGPDDGFCTSPRILTSVGGVGLFAGDEVEVKKAICEATGEMPEE